MVTIEPTPDGIPDDTDIGQSSASQFTITNHGLIGAEHVLLSLPTSPDHTFEFQSAVPSVLAAKQAVTCVNGQWTKGCNTLCRTRVYGTCGGPANGIPWTPTNTGCSGGNTNTGTGYGTGSIA